MKRCGVASNSKLAFSPESIGFVSDLPSLILKLDAALFSYVGFGIPLFLN